MGGHRGGPYARVGWFVDGEQTGFMSTERKRSESMARHSTMVSSKLLASSWVREFGSEASGLASGLQHRKLVGQEVSGRRKPN